MKELCVHIGTIRSTKLLMEEGKGGMADAIQEEYGQLDSVLEAMSDLVNRILENVRAGKEKFMQTDEELGKKWLE